MSNFVLNILKYLYILLYMLYMFSFFLTAERTRLPGSMEYRLTAQGRAWRHQTKRGSVSWLLAATMRMCQKHPNSCLTENGAKRSSLLRAKIRQSRSFYQ